jgi:carbonic anhydrase/acetyltransferase-like protein (isoleucine patch superfamily)
MQIEHEGKRPSVDPTAWIAPTAVLCGDVTVGPRCEIAFGAVIAAEGGSVSLGTEVIVREHAVIRATAAHPVSIGDHVLLGPHAMLRGCEVADQCFIATGVAMFDGARIGHQTEIRINGVVHANSTLGPNSLVPIGWIAVGDPAEVFPPDAHDTYESRLAAMDFPGSVYGVERLDRPGVDIDMVEVTGRLADGLGHHRNDRVL